jgi:REP element-mobilizing transposase RayT
MREPYTQLYVHLVWATWDRHPLITPLLEPRIYAAIAEKCRELKCVPIAIGGTEDHIHLLTRFHTTVSIATLVKEVKGMSSHLVTHAIMPETFFKWQGAYGAFTIRKSEVPHVKAYIENQKNHHAEKSLIPELEEVFDQEDAL